MKEYNVWFQNSHIIVTIRAENTNEARRIFNKYINIKQIKIESISNSPRQSLPKRLSDTSRTEESA